MSRAEVPGAGHDQSEHGQGEDQCRGRPEHVRNHPVIRKASIDLRPAGEVWGVGNPAEPFGDSRGMDDDHACHDAGHSDLRLEEKQAEEA